MPNIVQYNRINDDKDKNYNSVLKDCDFQVCEQLIAKTL